MVRVWFVRFAGGIERRDFETRAEAVTYAREMRRWYRAEGLHHVAIVGWARVRWGRW